MRDVIYPENRIFALALLAAFLLEALLLTFFGWTSHWLAHPPSNNDDARFIEAQVFTVPNEEAHLVEKPSEAPRQQRRQEVPLSRVPHQGQPKATPPGAGEEQNITEAGPTQPPTHGPLAIYSPAPVLPSYLRDKELKTAVVIDFYVNAQGVAVPRLVGSSGNEELDAIALRAVKQWQFRPAEADHKPVDAKVRLRILFEVH